MKAKSRPRRWWAIVGKGNIAYEICVTKDQIDYYKSAHPENGPYRYIRVEEVVRKGGRNGKA